MHDERCPRCKRDVIAFCRRCDQCRSCCDCGGLNAGFGPSAKAQFERMHAQATQRLFEACQTPNTRWLRNVNVPAVDGR